MDIFEVDSERKIVKKRGILAAHMYMENIGILKVKSRI